MASAEENSADAPLHQVLAEERNIDETKESPNPPENDSTLPSAAMPTSDHTEGGESSFNADSTETPQPEIGSTSLESEEKRPPKRKKRLRKRRISVSESDTDSSSTDTTIDTDTEKSYIKKASKLSSESIIRAFSRKLKRGGTSDTGKAKGPKLAESLIGYIDSLESRIRQLEEKIEESETESETDENLQLDGPDSERFLLETRFYDATLELLNGDFDPSRNTKANTFHSQTDPRHFIRAIFHWKSERHPTARVFGEGEIPDASDVDIIGIRIDSHEVSNKAYMRFFLVYL